MSCLQTPNADNNNLKGTTGAITLQSAEQAYVLSVISGKISEMQRLLGIYPICGTWWQRVSMYLQTEVKYNDDAS